MTKTDKVRAALETLPHRISCMHCYGSGRIDVSHGYEPEFDECGKCRGLGNINNAVRTEALSELDGFVLVPVEPTNEMLDRCLGKTETPFNRMFIAGCYNCMIAPYVNEEKK